MSSDPDIHPLGPEDWSVHPEIYVQLYDVGSVQGELTSRQRPRESNLDATEDEDDDDISH